MPYRFIVVDDLIVVDAYYAFDSHKIFLFILNFNSHFNMHNSFFKVKSIKNFAFASAFLLIDLLISKCFFKFKLNRRKHVSKNNVFFNLQAKISSYCSRFYCLPPSLPSSMDALP